MPVPVPPRPGHDVDDLGRGEYSLYKVRAIAILSAVAPVEECRESSGGVAEWSKAAVLKTAERKLRGFESLLLRRI